MVLLFHEDVIDPEEGKADYLSFKDNKAKKRKVLIQTQKRMIFVFLS